MNEYAYNVVSLCRSLNPFSNCLLAGANQDERYRGKDTALVGSMPSEIKRLTGLELLAMDDYRQLTGNILDNLKNMPLLETLVLSDSSFYGTIPETFAVDHLHLERLDLKGAGFYGKIPVNFESFLNLEYLDVSENELTGQIPSGFGDIPTLGE